MDMIFIFIICTLIGCIIVGAIAWSVIKGLDARIATLEYMSHAHEADNTDPLAGLDEWYRPIGFKRTES